MRVRALGMFLYEGWAKEGDEGVGFSNAKRTAAAMMFFLLFFFHFFFAPRKPLRVWVASHA